MKLTIAAIRSGTEPVGPLPVGAFHRTLEEPIYCPKCDATYNLVVEFDQANDRFFERDSYRLILALRRAISNSHANDHRTTHFETFGAGVRSYGKDQKDSPPEQKPRTERIM